MHHDPRIARSRDPILTIGAVDRDRNERLAVDEIVDARALLIVRFDLDEAAANRDVGVAASYDARAVAAELRLGRRAPTERDDRRGDYQVAYCHGAMLFVLEWA